MRTSANDPIQVGLLTHEHHGLPGRIGLTIAPGKKDPARSWDRDLDADLARLRSEYRASLLVSLMARHEYALLKIPDVAPHGLSAQLMDAHEALHRLWSRAAGEAGYDKASWKKLEASLESLGAPDAAVLMLFDAMRARASSEPAYDEQGWRTLARALGYSGG